MTITLKDNRFQPAEPHAPAGKAITIVVKNLDPAPAEFESNMLRVEKVVDRGRHDHHANPSAGTRPLPLLQRFPP